MSFFSNLSSSRGSILLQDLQLEGDKELFFKKFSFNFISVEKRSEINKRIAFFRFGVFFEKILAIRLGYLVFIITLSEERKKIDEFEENLLIPLKTKLIEYQ